jgi:hypothetical protein
LYSYFNKEFTVSAFNILLEIYFEVMRIYGIYDLVDTCTAQLDDYAKDLNYIEVLKNGDGSVVASSEDSIGIWTTGDNDRNRGFDWFRTCQLLFAVYDDITKIWFNHEQGFDFFKLAKAYGHLIGMTYRFLDEALNMYWI